MNKYLARANQLVPELVENRRHFHRHPEVRNELFETVKYVKAQLEDMGYQVQEICQCGLVVLAGGKKPGKCILIRGDMDALPMPEDTGLEFSSENPGAMHACGHDLHMAMLLGAAKLLKEHEDEIEGTVKICFQPNEETFGGAKAMIEAGVLENPHVDAALGMHSQSASDYPTGTIMHTTGPSAASADGFKVIVHGKGAHGASPEDGIDPVNILAHILIALQTINSRERNQQEPLILTIGQLIAGTAENIIPNGGYLTGTIRAFNQEVRAHAKRRLEEISKGIAATFGATAEIQWYTEFAPTINDRALIAELDGYVRELLGDDRVKITEPQMGSEDFSEVMLRVPGAFFNLSTGSREEGYLFGAHNPQVRHNEAALPTGSAVYAYTAMRWLEENC